MIGQGRPTTSHGCARRRAVAAATGLASRLALHAAVTLQAAVGFGQDHQDAIRVRVAWGGGAEQVWAGSISVDPGTLRGPSPLGIEADEAGSMWLEQGKLVIAQRSGRTFDGVDLLVDAPADARLIVRLAPEGRQGERQPTVVPLTTLMGESVAADLDDRGNRLLVRRAPGDSLRISTAERSMVFVPGQVVHLQVHPHRLAVPPESSVDLAFELSCAHSSDLLWSKRETVVAGEAAPVELEVPLGAEEGVYELAIRATTSAGAAWSARLRNPLGWRQTVAERRVQMVAVTSQRSRASASDTEPALTTVVEVDPANPAWFERFAKLPQLPGVPRLWKGPLGNGSQEPWQHELGTLARLRPSPLESDVSWEAYSLPIEQPGKPHVLAIRYPSDVPQTLGISIVEPNTAGAVLPVGLDSGIHLAEEIAGELDPPRWLEHRVIFWPRTKAPMVLFTNRRTDRPAVYGRIRVLAGWNRLPRALPPAGDEGPLRGLAAYLDRPLFPENFGASESPITVSDRSLDDWSTFYEGGNRLVEYLEHVGYSGLVLSVMADGSTIYPSDLVEATPRYDTGVLFEAGVDPTRKDVLEMLFRLFDREGLQLVPAMEFAAPLPQLEEALRRGGPEADGLQWVGADGRTWTQVHPPRRGLAPYYNVLDPRVQQALLAVIAEVVERYQRHPSFAGLALQLSGNGYAQLPGPQWGMDDATMARFQRDAEIELPARGPGRFAERSRLLNGTYRQKWLRWRAAELRRFYGQVDELLKAARPEARLFLTGADMFSGPGAQAELKPVLGRRTSVAEAMLRAGIDLEMYRQPEGPLLLRPEPVAPLGPPGVRAVHLELAQMPDADRCFASLPVPGSIFVQQPRPLRIPSFDQRSPFRRTHVALFAQPVPAGRQNRRRFVQSLAGLDAKLMLDGGWMLPLGGEETIRDLVAAYRRLPAIPFRRLADSEGQRSIQPLTVRYASHRGQTYTYVVNDSPVAATLRLRLDAPIGCRLEELSGMRSVKPLDYGEQGCSWTVDLEPYDLIAVRLGSPSIEFRGAEVTVPPAIQAALDARIRDLGTRAALLRSPPPLGVIENAGFEKDSGDPTAVADWAISRKEKVAIERDSRRAHTGECSVRLASEGPVACLVSRPFEAPSSGRFSMLVWLRVAEASKQPPVRLAVEWETAGREYRYAQLGQAEPGHEAVPIGTEWAPYIFQVYDLPLDGVGQMRVRFDLMGPGQVWIDDVQVSDLAFNRTELVELSKLITVASSKLQRGHVGDCIRLLEGYWPRFLERNVPLGAEGLARRPPKPQPDPPRQPERTGNVLDRLRGFVPRPLRF